jgi:hypothetical protein
MRGLLPGSRCTNDAPQSQAVEYTLLNLPYYLIWKIGDMLEPRS